MANAYDKLRMEFNQWAVEGRGEEMEVHYMSIAQQAIARMGLTPGDRALDLGCGTGWATRLLADAVGGGTGIAVGLDISEEMIARARSASRHLENILFAVASADEVPWRDEYFERALSIESFYYYPDQEAILQELHRVLTPGGGLFILINLYKENPYSQRWVDKLNVPVHLRSEAEYEEMLRTQGFVEIESSRISDLTATPEPRGGPWFATAEEMREFQRVGALLLTARKPVES